MIGKIEVDIEPGQLAAGLSPHLFDLKMGKPSRPPRASDGKGKNPAAIGHALEFDRRSAPPAPPSCRSCPSRPARLPESVSRGSCARRRWAIRQIVARFSSSRCFCITWGFSGELLHRLGELVRAHAEEKRVLPTGFASSSARSVSGECQARIASRRPSGGPAFAVPAKNTPKRHAPTLIPESLPMTHHLPSWRCRLQMASRSRGELVDERTLCGVRQRDAGRAQELGLLALSLVVQRASSASLGSAALYQPGVAVSPQLGVDDVESPREQGPRQSRVSGVGSRTSRAARSRS